ncbi:UNVERIFIED_CONTAM: hypothetical protein NCL1_19846 [Trichonephila clavipes]
MSTNCVHDDHLVSTAHQNRLKFSKRSYLDWSDGRINVNFFLANFFEYRDERFDLFSGAEGLIESLHEPFHFLTASLHLSFVLHAACTSKRFAPFPGFRFQPFVHRTCH